MAWDAGAAGQGTGHVVAVCNLKGGTGKSTLSVNIACALAIRGIRVALVDNDRQASATLWGSAGKLPITCLSLPLDASRTLAPGSRSFWACGRTTKS